MTLTDAIGFLRKGFFGEVAAVERTTILSRRAQRAASRVQPAASWALRLEPTSLRRGE
jgi:hypothetical protein